MIKSRQSSFRRILVTRILLVFVPVLFVGQLVALNKARSSLLKTARQNLTESAVIKGDKILDAIAALKANLFAASHSAIIQSGSDQEKLQFLTDLAQKLPNYIECLQLTNIQDGKIIASSCGNQTIAQFSLPFPDDGVDIRTVPHPQPGTTGQRDPHKQLQLVLSAPVYNRSGQLVYALNLQSALYTQIRNKLGSLTGSMVIIAEDGTILAHPSSELLGSNIKQHSDAAQLQRVIKNALGQPKRMFEKF